MKRLTYRAVACLAAALLLVSGTLTALDLGLAHAYGQVTSRSIELSNSTVSATGVSYLVSFDPVTTGTTIQGVVVDFCSNSPIIGDTCTAPSGFSVGTPTISGFSIPGESGGTWTAASANSGRTLTVTNGSVTGTPSGSAVSFTLSTVTNPSAVNTTFYARILTYATTGGVTTYTGDSTGQTTTGVVDAGGIAMSTAAQVVVTAKVQEQITFCVYTLSACGSGGTSVTLGDSHGVLSSAGPFVDKHTQYDISTNASSGAIIRLKGATLTSGSNSIAAIGATATASAADTAQFGLCNYEVSGSTLTPQSPYSDSGCSSTSQTAGTNTTGGDGGAKFAFNTTNTTSTYGDEIATDSAGTSATGLIAFIANIPVVQTAGIYTTTLIFIATGTY
jgi:hypothetical protein